MIIVRIIPVEPFMIINMVAGAAHIRFRDFVIDSAPSVCFRELWAYPCLRIGWLPLSRNLICRHSPYWRRLPLSLFSAAGHSGVGKSGGGIPG
jgi:hypothetical protein